MQQWLLDKVGYVISHTVNTLYHKSIIKPHAYKLVTAHSTRVIDNTKSDSGKHLSAAMVDLMATGVVEFTLVAVFNLPFGTVVECHDSWGR